MCLQSSLLLPYVIAREIIGSVVVVYRSLRPPNTGVENFRTLMLLELLLTMR